MVHSTGRVLVAVAAGGGAIILRLRESRSLLCVYRMLQALFLYLGHVYEGMVKRSGMCKVHRYQCLCKLVAACMLPLSHKEECFVKYQKNVLDIQSKVLSMGTSVGRYSEICVKYGHIS